MAKAVHRMRHGRGGGGAWEQGSEVKGEVGEVR